MENKQQHFFFRAAYKSLIAIILFKIIRIKPHKSTRVYNKSIHIFLTTNNTKSTHRLMNGEYCIVKKLYE